MDRIWAPWRSKYIKRKKPIPGCFLCKAYRSSARKDPKNLVLGRSSHNFIILNRYPYNNGHLMVVPIRHIASFEKLGEKERLDFLKLLDQSLTILKKALRPQGFNVGINLGQAAGAGVPGHLHLHVVPRWIGDTNFMPVIAETKVVSDSLEATYRKLHRLLGQKK